MVPLASGSGQAGPRELRARVDEHAACLLQIGHAVLVGVECEHVRGGVAEIGAKSYLVVGNPFTHRGAFCACAEAHHTSTRGTADTTFGRRGKILARHAIRGPCHLLVRAAGANYTGSTGRSREPGVAKTGSLLAVGKGIARTVSTLLRHPVMNLFGRALPTDKR